MKPFLRAKQGLSIIRPLINYQGIVGGQAYGRLGGFLNFSLRYYITWSQGQLNYFKLISRSSQGYLAHTAITLGDLETLNPITYQNATTNVYLSLTRNSGPGNTQIDTNQYVGIALGAEDCTSKFKTIPQNIRGVVENLVSYQASIVLLKGQVLAYDSAKLILSKSSTGVVNPKFLLTGDTGILSATTNKTGFVSNSHVVSKLLWQSF